MLQTQVDTDFGSSLIGKKVAMNTLGAHAEFSLRDIYANALRGDELAMARND